MVRITEKTYYAVFTMLIVLTFLTVGVSFLELGYFHTAVGLAIAAAKGTLVVLFFMHIINTDRVTWVAAGSGLFWLGILLVLTMADYMTRHWLAY